ncbi:MAG: thiamine pyrophosphate-binding protein [Alphaproteobacteria bacterium]
MAPLTVVDALLDALVRRGVRRIFGIPGGGSSLDVIEAAARCGVDFVLTRTETSGAMMAAATAEITGAPGVVITGLGPGAAAATNGIAYATLDRAPVVIITDSFDRETDAYVSHQAIDHAALFRAVVKGSMTLETGASPHDIGALIDKAIAHPFGAVHFDLSSRQAGSPARSEPPEDRSAPANAPEAATIAAARTLLAQATKPAIIAGVQARESPRALRDLAHELGCPVFTTYKAKGAIADSDPLAVGLTTGGIAEAECLSQADLIILYGFDPIELIPQPWRYQAPILEIGRVAGLPHYRAPMLSMIGALDASAAALRGANRSSGWTEDEIAGLKARMRDRLAINTGNSGGGVAPPVLVSAAKRHAPRGTRATVDAGAHMFSAMAFWDAEESGGVLISDGLSTMGYALPAAIASAIEEPERPVVCFTGDGGLLMSIAELATAVENKCRIVVLVFNDAALSLIDIKQQKRKMPTRGVRYPTVDFATIARGFGCQAWRVEDAKALDAALASAFRAEGPAIIDVAVDPSLYARQIEVLRG